MTGRASKRKGSAYEREIVHWLTSMGWIAKRVPLSGAAEGFKGDVHCARSQEDWNAGRKYVIECKRRAAGMAFMAKNCPTGGFLLYRNDHDEGFVIMRPETFRELVGSNGGAQ